MLVRYPVDAGANLSDALLNALVRSPERLLRDEEQIKLFWKNLSAQQQKAVLEGQIPADVSQASEDQHPELEVNPPSPVFEPDCEIMPQQRSVQVNPLLRLAIGLLKHRTFLMISLSTNVTWLLQAQEWQTNGGLAKMRG